MQRDGYRSPVRLSLTALAPQVKCFGMLALLINVPTQCLRSAAFRAAPMPDWAAACLGTPSCCSSSSHRPGSLEMLTSLHTPSNDRRIHCILTASSVESACKPRHGSQTSRRRKLPTSSCTSGAN